MQNVPIRASSLAELFDCPARWAAKHLDNLRMPTSGRAHLGTAIHAGTGAFDGGTVGGEILTVEDAVSATLEALKKPEEDVEWFDISPDLAEQIGITLTTKYCLDVSPLFTFDKVEEQLPPLSVDMGDGLIITLTGKMDRRYIAATGGRGIGDVKSGGRVIKTDSVTGELTPDMKAHGAQLAVYDTLELMDARTRNPAAITEPVVVFALETGPKARTAIGRLPRAHEVLLGTEEQPGMLDHAAGMLKSGLFHGNPRSTLCSPKYCPAWSKCRWRFADPVTEEPPYE